MLSVIVFSRNEQKNIIDCLKTVDWADEIVLIDDYSTDNTIKLAKKFKNLKVFKHHLKDFASQHNFAINKVKGDWLFFLDADERVSPALKSQIKQAVRSNQLAGFKVNRINIFLGKRLRYGGWSPDQPTRLFKKDKLKRWQGIIHESAQVKGKTGLLNGPFYHYGHVSLKSMLDKTIKWSDYEAQLRYQANHPAVKTWRVLKVGLTEFFNRLFLKQAWRDGTIGLIEVIYQTFSLMISYLKLWELQRK